LFDVVENTANKLKSKLKNSPEVHPDFKSLIDSPVDIIIEAASQGAVKEFGKPIIKAGKDLMIMSVGALVDTSFLAELLDQPAVRQVRSKILHLQLRKVQRHLLAPHFLQQGRLTST
jgi:predicted dinucleotide-utilizing enzyme